MDTIYALSSGGLPSGVAVVRLSGPHCSQVLRSICGGDIPPRIATLRKIRDASGLVLDEGLVLYFPAPRSFTGQDCVELQVHGGRAVVMAILAELSRHDGLRHAEAGEFSRRAFLDGKLDLLELEGLADLVSAETEMQRRLALEHAGGGQSRIYDAWADRLTHARAMIEAELDFADEDDVPGSVASSVWKDMELLRDEIATHLSGAALGEIIRDGLKIVISGPPNAGKSSLLNALAKRDVAIVTDIAGTTRDVLTVDMDLDGFAVRIYDTAGLRDVAEEIEAEGIRRARIAIDQADLVLALTDGASFEQELPADNRRPTIRVRTKKDLSGFEPLAGSVAVSTKSGAGLTELIEIIRSHLAELVAGHSVSIPSRIRHVQHLNSCLDSLTKCFLGPELEIEIRAEFLRASANSLGRITGRTDVEDLLDVIFSEFCIGK